MIKSNLTRRNVLNVGAGGVVSVTALAAGLGTPSALRAKPYSDKFTWISPRGTIDVMDDYAIWVANEMGYFGALGVELDMQAGPPGGMAVVQFTSVKCYPRD